MQKKIIEILVLTALTVGLIWTILELTSKSALLSLTSLYSHCIYFDPDSHKGGSVEERLYKETLRYRKFEFSLPKTES